MQLYIVLAYFALVLGVGVLAARKAKNSDEYLVAGRNMGVFMCSAAIAGEWIGGTSTIGTAEGGYLYGISSSWYVVANAIGTVVLAFTLAKLYRRSGSFTVTGYMEQYYGQKCSVVSSVVLTFVMIVVGSVQIVAGAALMNGLIGLNMKIGMLVVGAVFLAYTLAGGLWAVGFTNMLHVVVMYVGVILGLIMVSRQAGGFAALRAGLPARPFFDPFGAGASTVSAWIIASILAALVAQAAVQPVMAARDESVAQKGTLLAVVYIVPVGIITALLGMFARMVYPGIPGRSALPTVLMGLPPVAGGVVLAGVLAAILSTVSPCVLAAGTLLAKDVYQKVLRRDAGEAQVAAVAKWLTLASGILSIVWAMYCKVILEQIYFAYTLRGTIALLVLIGVYLPRIAKPGTALVALVATTVAALAWEAMKSLNGAYPMGVHPMHVSLVLTALVFAVGSLADRGAIRAGGLQEAPSTFVARRARH